MDGITILTDDDIDLVAGGEGWLREQGEKVGAWIAQQVKDVIDYHGPRQYRLHEA